MVACSKPPVLRNSSPELSSNLCISLTEETRKIQYIHGIFRPEYQPKKDRIDYYYYLTDFISEINDCNEYYAVIVDDKVGSIFTTPGTAKSYLRLQISISVDFFYKDEKLHRKLYEAESRTKVSHLFKTSKKEDKEYVVDALRTGIEDIVKQITVDLEQLD